MSLEDAKMRNNFRLSQVVAQLLLTAVTVIDLVRIGTEIDVLMATRSPPSVFHSILQV